MYGPSNLPPKASTQVQDVPDPDKLCNERLPPKHGSRKARVRPTGGSMQRVQQTVALALTSPTAPARPAARQSAHGARQGEKKPKQSSRRKKKAGTGRSGLPDRGSTTVPTMPESSIPQQAAPTHPVERGEAAATTGAHQSGLSGPGARQRYIATGLLKQAISMLQRDKAAQPAATNAERRRSHPDPSCKAKYSVKPDTLAALEEAVRRAKSSRQSSQAHSPDIAQGLDEARPAAPDCAPFRPPSPDPTKQQKDAKQPAAPAGPTVPPLSPAPLAPPEGHSIRAHAPQDPVPAPPAPAAPNHSLRRSDVHNVGEHLRLRLLSGVGSLARCKQSTQQQQHCMQGDCSDPMGALPSCTDDQGAELGDRQGSESPSAAAFKPDTGSATSRLRRGLASVAEHEDGEKAAPVHAACESMLPSPPTTNPMSARDAYSAVDMFHARSCSPSCPPCTEPLWTKALRKGDAQQAKADDMHNVGAMAVDVSPPQEQPASQGPKQDNAQGTGAIQEVKQDHTTPQQTADRVTEEGGGNVDTQPHQVHDAAIQTSDSLRQGASSPSDSLQESTRSPSETLQHRTPCPDTWSLRAGKSKNQEGCLLLESAARDAAMARIMDTCASKGEVAPEDMVGWYLAEVEDNCRKVDRRVAKELERAGLKTQRDLLRLRIRQQQCHEDSTEHAELDTLICMLLQKHTAQAAAATQRSLSHKQNLAEQRLYWCTIRDGRRCTSAPGLRMMSATMQYSPLSWDGAPLPGQGPMPSPEESLEVSVLMPLAASGQLQEFRSSVEDATLGDVQVPVVSRSPSAPPSRSSTGSPTVPQRGQDITELSLGPFAVVEKVWPRACSSSASHSHSSISPMPSQHGKAIVELAVTRPPNSPLSRSPAGSRTPSNRERSIAELANEPYPAHISARLKPAVNWGPSSPLSRSASGSLTPLQQEKARTELANDAFIPPGTSEQVKSVVNSGPNIPLLRPSGGSPVGSHHHTAGKELDSAPVGTACPMPAINWVPASPQSRSSNGFATSHRDEQVMELAQEPFPEANKACINPAATKDNSCSHQDAQGSAALVCSQSRTHTESGHSESGHSERYGNEAVVPEAALDTSDDFCVIVDMESTGLDFDGVLP
jgi:hypothetical protein